MKPDSSRINAEARAHVPAMSAFLRDMLRLPSESRREEAVIRRIQDEMDKVGYDTVNRRHGQRTRLYRQWPPPHRL